MYWNRSAAEIAALWQVEIENKFETGTTALLLGGSRNSLIASAPALLALQYSMRHRNDIATPLLVAGGNSAHWLGLLLPPLPTGSAPTAPLPTVIYGGADEATYLAVVGLTSALANQSLMQSRSTSGTPVSSTPSEMGVLLAPHLHPGAAADWEMLPLLEVGEQPAPGYATGLSPELAMTTAAADPAGDWIAWGVMLLAFCLVLSALLI